MTRDSVDLLSFCPSLIDILCYIEYEKLSDVQLVCRRTNDVINRYRHLMSRPRADLHIVIAGEIDREFLFLCCRCAIICPYWSWFYITEDGMRQFDRATELEDHPREKGTRIYIDHHYQDPYIQGQCLDPALMEQSALSINFGKHKDVAIGSIEEGLELVFPPIFRRFYFQQITIKKNARGIRQENWVNMLCDEFQKAGSNCRQLSTKVVFTEGMEIFCRTLDPVKMLVFLQGNNLADFLLRQSFDRELTILADPEELHSPRQLLQLITRWNAGEISIHSLTIRTRKDFELNPLYFVPKEYPFSHLDLVAAFDRFHIVGRDFRSPSSVFKRFTIQRPTDLRYLRIQYKSRRDIQISERRRYCQL